MKRLFLLMALISFFACKNEKKQPNEVKQDSVTTEFNYAKGFSITHNENFKKRHNTDTKLYIALCKL